MSDLVNDLWSLLNGEEDDNIIKTHPLDPADRVMYKVHSVYASHVIVM